MKVFSRRGGTSLGSLIMLGLAVYGGYTGWQNYKSPYKLIENNNNGIYSLIEKDTNKRQEITRDFQLGTIDYRIDGILRESKGRVKESLETLSKKYNLN
jgi:hypothetical protein